ncbi:hypothetical protein NIES37_00370 [Tolypothrix tenuis PCC 7101]|uniref:Uncharacterized protein n=1 Tax=Tolypothrix tenuis PCC 7101 TaxID=231146 RepID=A0A1Z4MRX0_9CYAN|nr:hypothetical protein NIES37_00370 [Tolypothrix tenuis PCC 7101]BAZ73382.1 hypothetical protein NIES50_19470 [Aulosira laxa NIES-50]
MAVPVPVQSVAFFFPIGIIHPDKLLYDALFLQP